MMHRRMAHSSAESPLAGSCVAVVQKKTEKVSANNKQRDEEKKNWQKIIARKNNPGVPESKPAKNSQNPKSRISQVKFSLKTRINLSKLGCLMHFRSFLKNSFQPFFVFWPPEKNILVFEIGRQVLLFHEDTRHRDKTPGDAIKPSELVSTSNGPCQGL